MSGPTLSDQDVATLAALANGIIPADARDAGAASVHAGPGIARHVSQGVSVRVYVEGLKTAGELAREKFGCAVHDLGEAQIHVLIVALRERSPAFFRQLRADVCARYLSDPDVWRRIGFPGPSSERGGYPDFDQPPGNNSRKAPQTMSVEDP